MFHPPCNFTQCVIWLAIQHTYHNFHTIHDLSSRMVVYAVSLQGNFFLQIYALLTVKFPHLKLRLCKKWWIYSYIFIYEVCPPPPPPILNLVKVSFDIYCSIELGQIVKAVGLLIWAIVVVLAAVIENDVLYQVITWTWWKIVLSDIALPTKTDLINIWLIVCTHSVTWLYAHGLPTCCCQSGKNINPEIQVNFEDNNLYQSNSRANFLNIHSFHC